MLYFLDLGFLYSYVCPICLEATCKWITKQMLTWACVLNSLVLDPFSSVVGANIRNGLNHKILYGADRCMVLKTGIWTWSDGKDRGSPGSFILAHACRLIVPVQTSYRDRLFRVVSKTTGNPILLTWGLGYGYHFLLNYEWIKYCCYNETEAPLWAWVVGADMDLRQKRTL